MKIASVVERVVGEENMGRLEFLLHPGKQIGFGGPFNGQRYRQRIFFDLLYHFQVSAIVETGMYRGTTTALFAATSLPVYTTEIQPRYFAFSRMRFLFNQGNVHQYRSDSRAFLRTISTDRSMPTDNVFFYLDAHWQDDLPLREELEIIFSKWNRPLVMIDDFKVPESGYGFDDYGPDKTLDLSYIASVVAGNKLAVFFPAVSSVDETGGQRGSVVLCRETQAAELEARMTTLMRHHGRLQLAP